MAHYNGFRIEEYDDPRTLDGSLKPDYAEEEDAVFRPGDVDESYEDDFEDDYAGRRSHTYRIQSF